MKYLLIICGALTLAAAIAGCNIASTGGQVPAAIVADTVARETLSLDSTVTYHYTFPLVSPDSVFLALYKAGIPVAQGLEAIDYLCMDPLGPRFMVVLTTADDARMSANFFSKGDWRVPCSPHYRRLRIK